LSAWKPAPVQALTLPVTASLMTPEPAAMMPERPVTMCRLVQAQVRISPAQSAQVGLSRLVPELAKPQEAWQALLALRFSRARWQ
jgi:hypothetical protein